MVANNPSYVSNKTPVPQRLFTAQCVAAVAKTDYNTNTNLVLAYTPPVGGGGLIKQAVVNALASSQLSKLIIWRFRNGLYLPVDQIALPAYTVSQTAIPTPTPFPRISESTPIRVPDGETLWFSTGVSLTAGFGLTLEGEEYLAYGS